MNDWLILNPWWLLLPAVTLPLLLAAATRVGNLPGNWHRIVATDLHGFMRRWLSVPARKPRRLLRWGLLLLLCMALADVSVGTNLQAPERAIHARVLVIDTAAGEFSGSGLFTARQLAISAPEIPTAIVATSANAYDVVPLTGDPGQLERYLQVLTHAIMPEHGRAPERGIERARLMLRKAGMLASQIVLLSSGPAPQSGLKPHPGARVWIVLPTAPDASWQQFASNLDARITGPDDIAALNQALLTRRDRAIMASAPLDERRRLTPWLIAGALVLWLILFFKPVVS